MKRTLATALFLAVFCCLSALPCSASPGKARFGTGVDKNWELVNEAREFDTNLVTCGFYGTKPFGAMQVVVSIYHQEKPGSAEALLTRANLDINPQWGILILPDLPLPGTGTYTFNLAKAGGEVLADGKVTITQKKVEKKMPAQPKVDGTTLEGLFNKFKPMN